MTPFLSRIVISVALLPIVLGAVWLGHWWMFALVAIAAALALHEYWLMARTLSPLAPAGYIGAALGLVGAEMSGVSWMLAGLLSTFALAFMPKALSEARAAATGAISATVMGTFWIGGGLGFLIVLRDLPDHGRLALVTLLVAVWAGDTFAYFGGGAFGRHTMAPSPSPGKPWEGFDGAILGRPSTRPPK